MVLPLGKQAADRPGADDHATLCFGAAWGGGAASAVDARLTLRAFLAHGRNTAPATIPASLAVDAELVVSELITNAIRHAPGPCELILRLFRGQLAITVRDTSAEQPTVRQGDRFRVGGHGLRLVHTVSERVAVARRARGKQITAYLRLAPHDHASAGAGAGAGRSVLAAG
jgi:anti-sigma regulatory factor (Ser/Thr protein kinase)